MMDILTAPNYQPIGRSVFKERLKKCWQSFLLIGIFFCHLIYAAPPTLFDQPFHQSPVSVSPNGLLLLAGFGFTADNQVVYQQLSNSTQPLQAPVELPTDTSVARGFAEVVSVANIPHSLTVRLPDIIDANQTYAFWVRNSQGEWSNPIKVNDARPLWLTPDFSYTSAAIASMPRRLKIVGRNLRSAPDSVTRVRLTGPRAYSLIALNDDEANTRLESYVAIVDLPPLLVPGNYTVEVSRDDRSWVALKGQQFTVKPDPKSLPIFKPGNYGGCVANDGLDDVVCIIKAIEAASKTGGIVIFSSGVWDLKNSTVRKGIRPRDGIIIPPGVSLMGAGANVTTISLDKSWSDYNSKANTVFTLQGNNEVKGIKFIDQKQYSSTSLTENTVLRLGKTWYRADPKNLNDPKSVDHIIITQNDFVKSNIGISDGGLPMSSIYINNNRFGAFRFAISLGGDTNNLTYPFTLNNSVITGNTFKPGSYINSSIGQGTIATSIGAAHQVDFSDNTADGTSTEFFYRPASEQKGWRAAHFWQMVGNLEKMLVTNNYASCTGDKAGDGEAIAYDNNHNTFAFDSARNVLNANGHSVIVKGPLKTRQNNKDISDIIETYYQNHWITIAAGPGLGQVRKISAYEIDPKSANVTFTVTPEWDVVPQGNQSRITIGRQFWQIYTLDNTIDHRSPLCAKGNLNGPEGGAITHWAQTADSVVAGNRQYSTDGIDFQQSYESAGTSFTYFTQIHNNLIDGEYNWSSDCSWSGIAASHSAAPSPQTAPPVAGYGNSIFENTIRQADSVRGGAISIPLTWHAGPKPSTWNLVNNTLIFNNNIENIEKQLTETGCDHNQSQRVGINLHNPTVWNTVLYNNTCKKVDTKLLDKGRNTLRVCDSNSADDCGCDL